MADDTKRTLIALGSFTPVGGGGGEIPANLCVCTLEARQGITTPEATIGNVKACYLNSCNGASINGDLTAEGDIIAVGGVDTTRLSLHDNGSCGTLKYDTTKDALTWMDEVVETTSNIIDLPRCTNFTLKNGKKYQVKTDSPAYDNGFDFAGVSVAPDSTAEIWFKVGSRQPQDIHLPSDWCWIGTSMDDTIDKNSHFSIAVRKVTGYDGVSCHDITVANVAYSFTAPAGS